MAALSGSDLRGKIALVVGGGATGGIGFATAEAFAAGGATVALADLPAVATAKTLAKLSPKGRHSAHSVNAAPMTGMNEKFHVRT